MILKPPIFQRAPRGAPRHLGEFSEKLGEDELSVLEKELLIQVRQLSRDDLRKLIAQARALAEFTK